ncbi:hypothetical protein SAMN04487846_1876 [Microbacterium sp. cf046]|uniref:hypothetical protein n=1 Tax=Microbacterium sp. cf046 TaxID=1761803 RepID=UPI0008E6DD9A|nr:hypothetical protein [Microbacterium sp. cf046]SFS04827.1 hypothetical protein SAMN04487846_1876 [Microbacterium sp. cf046]
MRGLRDLIGRLNAPRASRWLIGTSMLLLTLWLQAHLALAALHDDGTTVRNAITVYNSGDVRGQLSGAVDWVFDRGAELSSADAELASVNAALAAALQSGTITAPVSSALVDSLTSARDDLLAQFDGEAPVRGLAIGIGPLLSALEIPVTPELVQSLGLPASAVLAVPVADAQTVEVLRQRYGWAVLIDRWGLLVGMIAGAAGVILSERPLRTLAIVLGIGGALCLLAIPLFGVLNDWLVGGGAGGWSPLVAPLVTSAVDQIRPWLLPVGVGAMIVGAASFVGLLLLERRRSAPRAPEDDQEERAIRASTP